MALPKRQTDIGPPKYDQLYRCNKKNYGKWKYHEVLTGGTMVHVAESAISFLRKGGITKDFKHRFYP